MLSTCKNHAQTIFNVSRGTSLSMDKNNHKPYVLTFKSPVTISNFNQVDLQS